MTALVVIPARWGSVRFEGKPLARLAGRTMLERAVDIAARAITGRPGVDMVVATDDERIATEARRLDQQVILTSPTLTSGSARALAAAERHDPRPAWIVNLQADAPFTSVASLGRIIDAAAQSFSVATPVVQLDWEALDALRHRKITAPFSGTCCIRDQSGRGLWFSKQIIPAVRNESELRRSQPLSPVYRHLGLYGYTLEALRQFEAQPPSTYERLEGLEQLRLIELGIPILTVPVADGPVSMNGIDTPEDLAFAEELIRQRGDPFGR